MFLLPKIKFKKRTKKKIKMKTKKAWIVNFIDYSSLQNQQFNKKKKYFFKFYVFLIVSVWNSIGCNFESKYFVPCAYHFKIGN